MPRKQTGAMLAMGTLASHSAKVPPGEATHAKHVASRNGVGMHKTTPCLFFFSILSER